MFDGNTGDETRMTQLLDLVGIRALLLECTGMQPFARAVQQAVDLPIFSWGTLLDYAYSVVSHRDYYGHV